MSIIITDSSNFVIPSLQKLKRLKGIPALPFLSQKITEFKNKGKFSTKLLERFLSADPQLGTIFEQFPQLAQIFNQSLSKDQKLEIINDVLKSANLPKTYSDILISTVLDYDTDYILNEPTKVDRGTINLIKNITGVDLYSLIANYKGMGMSIEEVLNEPLVYNTIQYLKKRISNQIIEKTLNNIFKPDPEVSKAIEDAVMGPIGRLPIELLTEGIQPKEEEEELRSIQPQPEMIPSKPEELEEEEPEEIYMHDLPEEEPVFPPSGALDIGDKRPTEPMIDLPEEEEFPVHHVPEEETPQKERSALFGLAETPEEPKIEVTREEIEYIDKFSRYIFSDVDSYIEHFRLDRTHYENLFRKLVEITTEAKEFFEQIKKVGDIFTEKTSDFIQKNITDKILRTFQDNGLNAVELHKSFADLIENFNSKIPEKSGKSSSPPSPAESIQPSKHKPEEISLPASPPAPSERIKKSKSFDEYLDNKFTGKNKSVVLLSEGQSETKKEMIDKAIKRDDITNELTLKISDFISKISHITDGRVITGLLKKAEINMLPEKDVDFLKEITNDLIKSKRKSESEPEELTKEKKERQTETIESLQRTALENRLEEIVKDIKGKEMDINELATEIDKIIIMKESAKKKETKEKKEKQILGKTKKLDKLKEELKMLNDDRDNIEEKLGISKASPTAPSTPPAPPAPSAPSAPKPSPLYFPPKGVKTPSAKVPKPTPSAKVPKPTPSAKVPKPKTATLKLKKVE